MLSTYIVHEFAEGDGAHSVTDASFRSNNHQLWFDPNKLRLITSVFFSPIHSAQQGDFSDPNTNKSLVQTVFLTVAAELKVWGWSVSLLCITGVKKTSLLIHVSDLDHTEPAVWIRFMFNKLVVVQLLQFVEQDSAALLHLTSCCSFNYLWWYRHPERPWWRAEPIINGLILL